MGRCFRGAMAIALFFASATMVAAQPSAPGNLQASVSGTTVSLAWTPATGASGYRLEAGSAPGLSDLATVSLGADPSYTVPNVPAGSYHVRVRSLAGGSVGGASNEIIVTVGAGGPCFTAPSTPAALRAVVNGTQVNVSWTPAGCAATSYLVRAGSVDGAADIAQLSVATPSLSANAPDGVYFVSVVAINAYGASAPTGSVIVLVAAPTSGGRVSFNTATPAVSVGPDGNAVIVGEVVNRSTTPAVFIRVGAQVRDGSGNVIGAGATFLRGQSRRLNATGIMDDSALGPGEIGCFYIQTNIPATQVRDAVLQLNHDSFSSSKPRSTVDAIDATRLPDPNFAKLSVTITNRGPEPTFFNVSNLYMKRPDGRAVGCDFAFADDALAPGQVTGIAATTHAPATVTSIITWMHWQQSGDPLGALAAQTFQSMRSLVNSGQKREAQAAWEALQTQRRAAAASVGQ